MVTLRIGSGVALPGAGAVWAGGDAVLDGDLLGADEEDVLDEQPQDALAVVDGGGGGVAAQRGEEAFQVAGEGEAGVPVGGLGVEGVDLGVQVRPAGAQVRHLGAQLVDGQELLGECLGHGGDRGGGLGQLEFEAGPLPGGGVAGAGLPEPLASHDVTAYEAWQSREWRAAIVAAIVSPAGERTARRAGLPFA